MICSLFRQYSLSKKRGLRQPSSGKNLPQIVAHILQKAFFRHVLGQWLSQSSLNISSKFLLHQFSIIHSKFSPEEYLVNISMYFKAFIGVIVCIISMCFRRNYILFSGSNTTMSASLPSAITPLFGYTPYNLAGFSHKSWHIFSTVILPVRTP